MFQTIKNLLKTHRDIILYLIFGVLTTLVNYLIYFPMFNLLHISALISNSVAWLISVIVAFLTNKPFVFKSYNWSFSVVVPEFVKFISCRILSGVLETAILWLAVDIMQWNGNVWKLLTMVFVIVINYIGSRWIVFRGK